MPYLADYFRGNPGTWANQDDQMRGGPGMPPPVGITPPNSGATSPAGGAPAGAPGPAGGGQAGPGTGFVPLASYFAPNREGAQGLAQGLMAQFPSGMATDNAGPTGPRQEPGQGYRQRDANSQAEASAAFDTMNPLDSFLAKQAGGQGLFDRLAQWAQPYTPPPPPVDVPDYGAPMPAPPPPERTVGGHDSAPKDETYVERDRNPDERKPKPTAPYRSR